MTRSLCTVEVTVDGACFIHDSAAADSKAGLFRQIGKAMISHADDLDTDEAREYGNYYSPSAGRWFRSPASPEDVAESIARATDARRRMLLLSPVSKLSWWLSRLWPAAFDRIMERQLLQDEAPRRDGSPGV